MKPELNQQLIDQLACGDLHGTDYRRAILALEADPQKWRDCALAFLQEQAITHELTQLAGAGENWNQPSLRQPTENKILGNTVSVPANSGETSGAVVTQSKYAWIYRAASLAAIMLLSFTVGWLASAPGTNRQNGSSQVSDLAAGNNSSSTRSPGLKLDAMSVEKMLPDSRLVSNNSNGDGNSQWSLLPIDQQIPAGLARLEREGQIKIETKMALMPVDHEGVMMFVPVQQIRVVPTTFSY